MAIVMPSRFACLKIEDDDFRPAASNKSKDKKSQKVDGKHQPGKKQAEQKIPKKVNKPGQPLQNQPNKKDKKKKETAEQWDEWMQKDKDYVNDNYENDLQNAIMLSKLDFEEKKDYYKEIKAQADQEKKKPENGKKKKNKAMSLEQFNNLHSNIQEQPVVDHVVVEEQSHFFDRIKDETKEIIKKEEADKSRKLKERKLSTNETVTIAHYQVKLDKLKSENDELRAQLAKAKAEILTVKTRNKTLCEILAQGEMKDKADVLLEVERLNKVRDELTEEVTKLHTLLEQERSKVGILTADTHSHNKQKNKKRPGIENAAN